MKRFTLVLAGVFLLASNLAAQQTTNPELQKIQELYQKTEFNQVVLKATSLLQETPLSKADSITAIRMLTVAAAQDNKPDIAQTYLLALIKIDANTDFKSGEMTKKFQKVWFKTIKETNYVPGQKQGLLTVAVVEFDNGSLVDPDKVKNVGIGVSAMIRYELESSGSVHVPSREHINYLLDELKLGQTDLADPSNKVQIGKVIGAKNFIFGTFFNMPKNEFRLDARIIDTETTLPKKQFSVKGKADKMQELTMELSKQILEYFNLESDKLKKAELPSVNLAALIKVSQAIAMEEKGDQKAAQKLYSEALAIAPGFALANEGQQRVQLDLGSQKP